jgi:deoxyribodipyrimidine photo-lyase
MLEGLQEVARSLRERGIGFVIRTVSPEKGVLELAKAAALVVVDRDYLRFPRQWRQFAAERMSCPLVQVETNVVVPVEAVSPKEEYSAATIRPKIMRQMDRFMVPGRRHALQRGSLGIDIPSLDVSDIDAILAGMDIDRSVPAATAFRGGTREAKKRLRAFIREKLDRYPDERNDPNADCQSGMSPYLHFGQMSPLDIALEVAKSGSPAVNAFLEELIVRRELGMNFVYYNACYDSFEGLPPWAKASLLDHAEDHREYLYSLEQLERAETHDSAWNAAQSEMRITGKMHGYMRMYWGKKIIEWSRSPRAAFDVALRLNNRYELDGRDANGFAAVAWCFGKHDRPWARRKIFGTVRYMNDKGLKRKFDVDEYSRSIRSIECP